MRFSEVIGQEDAKRRLSGMVREGRMPHALLLCGPPGSGKMALALALASYLLCGDREDGDSCGRCPQCAMLRSWAHPDLHFSFPVIRPAGTPSEHKMVSDDFIAEWRAMLARGPYFTMDTWLSEMGAANQQAQMGVGESADVVRKLSLKPSQGGYRVSLVWLPERMNDECANKLLKIIEEPPRETVFIMVSEEPGMLLETVRSRAQRMDIRGVAPADMERALVERRGIDAGAARMVSRRSGGSWTAALQEIASGGEEPQFLEDFKLLMRLCYRRRVRELRDWSDAVAGYGRERQRRMLLYFLRMTRENFIYNFHDPGLNYMSGREEDFARNFSPFVNGANVAVMASLFDRAMRDIGQNANARIVFFDMATHMILALMGKPG